MLWTRGIAMLGAACALLGAGAAPAEPAQPTAESVGLPNEEWVGDLDGMIERRLIRVLVVHNKTLYFFDRGTPRGASHDVFKAFEDELNKKLKAKYSHVHVVFLPVARDELLPALIEGRGDIAAANLTITAQRMQSVDFANPVLSDVAELIITGPKSPKIATLDDLAGKEVFVRKSSSYHDSLLALNARFRSHGQAEVRITQVPESLEDEDLLEMLNAGLIGLTVVNSFQAEFWAQLFPNIVLHPDIAVRTGGEIAWAIRKNSPKLRAVLDAFGATRKTGTAFGNELFRRYFKSTKYAKRAASEAELQKLFASFQKYSNNYGLDWMLVAAQAYQESRFDHRAKSRDGAIGVMQVMPATGKALKVGDIRRSESNINAGTKYLRQIIDRYLTDEPMDDVNRMLFALSSYNAGPTRVQELREEAGKRGLDQNVWFGNVEVIAAEKLGSETVTYVSNIHKYYVAYRRVHDERMARRDAKQELLEGINRSNARSLHPNVHELLGALVRIARNVLMRSFDIVALHDLSQTLAFSNPAGHQGRRTAAVFAQNVSTAQFASAP